MITFYKYIKIKVTKQNVNTITVFSSYLKVLKNESENDRK